MYRRNHEHLQQPLLSGLDGLSEKRRRLLKESWAETFYRDLFCRINEDVFEVLYSDAPSRPNVAVNQLVGFEILKAGHGWSDAEAYDAVCFNVQVRYALGLRDLSDETFSLRTVYNFRRAVSEHMAATGANLFEEMFKQITDEQLRSLELGSTRLRMDSTQVASNIRMMSRLQLLVEVLQRVHRILDEEDRGRFEEEFAEFTRGSAGQYSYHLKDQEPREHLDRIGRLMLRLVRDLEPGYGDHETYGTLKRVLHEQFAIGGRSMVIRRPNEDVSAQSLQSPDDQEATYRRRQTGRHRGYVMNLAETCDEENDVQLIVDVAVKPNSTDDADMLAAAADELAVRTDVREIHTDGGYNSPAVDESLRRLDIEQYQTAIRGRSQSRERLGREDFDWKVDDDGQPIQVTCPEGQTAIVERARSDRFVARFEDSQCRLCPLREECPTKHLKRKRTRVMRVSQRNVDSARRVRRSRELRASSANPRAAIEGTVWSVVSCFPHNKVPVRGHARVAMHCIATTLMANVRRISRITTVQPPESRDSSPTAHGIRFIGTLCSMRKRFFRLGHICCHNGAMLPSKSAPLTC